MRIVGPAGGRGLNSPDANIAVIAATCRRQHAQWRPHVKLHASPPLAKRLVAGGAIGVTCAKVGEAEIMAAVGVRGILVAKQVVRPRKIARLVDLARDCDVIVAVDSLGDARVPGVRGGASLKLSQEHGTLILAVPSETPRVGTAWSSRWDTRMARSTCTTR